jgi:hypothetical protein
MFSFMFREERPLIEIPPNQRAASKIGRGTGKVKDENLAG